MTRRGPGSVGGHREENVFQILFLGADLFARAEGLHVAVVDYADVMGEFVRELQRIKVSSRDLIAVLDGLVKIGALRAEIVVE